MSTLEIEDIVAEVLRRIKLCTGKKHALVLVEHSSGSEAVQNYLKCLEGKEYVLTQVLPRGEDPCCSLEMVHQVLPLGLESTPPFSELIRKQDLVVASGLTLAHFSNIRDIRINGDTEALICEALRQGKRVRVFSDAVDTSAASEGFAAKVLALQSELESYGMEFQSRFIAPQVPRQLFQPVINKQDLLNIETGLIIVGQDTVFTTSAKLLLREKNIEVIRQ